ncbi:hypothetical protein N9Z54_04450 [Planctomycetota bacterium]|nr:hypothetical protein [Planctomycetota bacterium]
MGTKSKNAYTDKQGNVVGLQELLKGKKGKQLQALKLFHCIPISEGCFSKEYLTLAAYERIVDAKRDGLDLRRRAIEKLGIDEDQVREIDPICLEGYREFHDKINPYLADAIDGKGEGSMVSSMYEVTWLFFGDEQVFVYNHGFDTTDDSLVDTTQEYFYQDITSFVTSSESVQKKIWNVNGEGCSSLRKSEMRMVNSELFRIVVPGETFTCAYHDDGDTARQISAMKQKLREKKQQ